ncbi:extracellular solute-binding protein [Frondihabitans cladoniiphilus]|uniref:Extracellular solute-binding protein n=1 Tax=Frondihabitans cladoniiphilus TaxID=715785 RepID=A0ABP8WEW3_9MICO
MHSKMRKVPLLVGIAACLTIGLAACAPGGSTATSTASLGSVSKTVTKDKITLTEWDQNTDGGSDTAQKELNAAFEKKYPNITIKRVSQSFSDLKTTLKLALSGNTPPDVVQANQGYPDMGAFVKGGLLRPMDDYAKLYDWTSYYPSSLLKLNTFSSDGKTWQTGNLYGVSQTGELVGVYYNKAILDQLGVSAPKTIDDLTVDMAKAKAAGILPLNYGNLEKSPGIHLYGVVQAAVAGATAVDDLVTAKSGSWTDKDNVTAAATIQGWVDKGYINAGSSGISRDASLASFGKGGSAFYVDGTWQQQTLESDMGKTAVGFTTLTPVGASAPVTEGGEGLAWAITSKSKHADAAAAYIDFITNAKAAQTLLDTGNLPAVLPTGYSPTSGTLAADIADQYTEISKASTVVPYLDYTTSTFYDTLTSGMQNLVGGQATPEQFTQSLQTDYEAFTKDRG